MARTLWNPNAPSYAMADPRLSDRIRTIVLAEAIQCVVETGVNTGRSTLEFARLPIRKVVGIDVDLACIACALGMLQGAAAAGMELAPWTLYLGDSAGVLKEISPQLPEATIYFLDAHWQQDRWPLLEEITAIPRSRGVVALHDFGVPGREGTGHVQPLTGERLTLSYVQGTLEAWSPGFRTEFLPAEGDWPGTCFAFPA